MKAEDEEDFDEEAESLVFTIGEDGKATIHKQEDYIEMLKKDADLIVGFIKANKKEFDDFVKKTKEAHAKR